MKAQRSIRFWLLALIVSAILPITVFAALVAERLAESEQQALIEQLRQRTYTLAHAVGRHLETSYTALTALAESTELQHDDFAGLHALARRLLSRQAIGTTIGLVGRDGRFILNTHFPYGESLPSVSGDDISRQVFATGRPQASDLFLGTVTLDLLVTLDVPVFRNGQTIYDLRIGIRPDTLASVLADQALPDGWTAVIVDRKGRFIARNHAQDRVGEQASAALRNHMAESETGVFDGATVTGTPIKASFQTLRSSGWTVVIGVPQTILAAPFHRSLALVGAGGFAFLLIGGTGAFVLARRLSRQIRQATAAAVALGEDRAPAAVKTDSRELSALCHALGQAHRLLRQRDERLALALDAAQAGPWEYDATAGILVWSPESIRLYGFDPGCPPRTFAEWLVFVREADRSPVEAEVRRFRINKLDTIRTEFRICHPQAGPRCLLAVGRGVYGPDRALLRMVGLTLDITERKAAEEALRDNKERLVFVLDAARAGWWDWDLRGGKWEWSEQLRQLLGYGDTFVVPSLEAWAEKIHPDDRAAAMEAVTSSLAGKTESYRAEYRVARPGDCWVLAVGKTTRDSDGKPSRLVGLSLDITQLKAAEQATLQAKQEAERANLAKSKFLAAASHDLRQPVQSLMLFTPLLRQEITGDTEGKIVDHIDKAALALKSLLDGILDISRLDAGIILPQPTDIAAAPLLDQLASAYRLLAGQKGLDLRVVQTGLWLRTDPVLLERILRNLIENAIKYTPVGRILIGCRRSGKAVRLEVWDTGLGIPDDQSQAIFMEFHQLDNPERDRAKGLGLGLAIVQRLARLLGHPVLVRSVPGKGSCFSVTVPVGTPVPAPLIQPPSPQPAGLFAVIVDDEEEIRRGLRLLLEDWGYEVVTGADHRDVIPQLGGRRPDLVLADYRLRGGLTGIDVLRAIAEAVGDPVRRVVLTGDTAPDNIAEAWAGGYEVVHKPVTATALRAFLA